MRKKTLVNAIFQTLCIAGVPVPTPDLIAIHGEGKKNPRQTVWNALHWMQRTGRVRKGVRIDPRCGCMAWWETI